MLSRRAFIKGMGALALLPLIPAILIPRPTLVYGVSPASEFMEASRKLNEMMAAHIVQWNNRGIMTYPHTEDGERTDYKVRYTVTEDGTESEIVE